MINSHSAHDVHIITTATDHHACFRSRSFQNRVFYPLTCLLLLIMVMLANLTDLSAQEQGCKYLGQYMAPFKPPIENWSTDLAGPAPGDVEVRMVGPQECRIITEQKITNAKGTAYRHITMAVSGTVFGYAPVNSKVLPPLGTGEEGEGQEHFFSDHAFIWQARGIMGPFIPGVGHYQYTEATPSSLEILIPENPADWNGSMWMLVHGGSRFSPLEFQPRKPDQFNR